MFMKSAQTFSSTNSQNVQPYKAESRSSMTIHSAFSNAAQELRRSSHRCSRLRPCPCLSIPQVVLNGTGSCTYRRGTCDTLACDTPVTWAACCGGHSLVRARRSCRNRTHCEIATRRLHTTPSTATRRVRILVMVIWIV